jgi:hypothetical protein
MSEVKRFVIGVSLLHFHVGHARRSAGEDAASAKVDRPKTVAKPQRNQCFR